MKREKESGQFTIKCNRRGRIAGASKEGTLVEERAVVQEMKRRLDFEVYLSQLLRLKRSTTDSLRYAIPNQDILSVQRSHPDLRQFHGAGFGK